MLNWRGLAHGHQSFITGAWLKTLLLSLCGVMALLAGAHAAQAEPPRLAMGLIVKLKDAQPSSVVRLTASRLSRETPQQLRLHMAAVAQRKHVSYLVHRPTAFAANVIHSGYPITVAEAKAQAARLRADPDVEWVVVNELQQRQSVTVPTDPYYGGSSGQTWLQAVTDVAGGRAGVAGFPAAWGRLTGATLWPVAIALLDTGILPHPDLAGRVLPGYDFVSNAVEANDGDGVDSDPTDPGDWVDAQDKAAHPDLFGSCKEEASSWHGTSIAGMLVANADKGLYGAGMLGQLNGPNNARPMLLPVRVAGKCGAELSDIIEGMLWAAGVSYQGSPTTNPYPAKIINLSFGSDGPCSATTSNDQRDAGWLYAQTVATLRNNGVLLVASAGNGDGVTGNATPSRPASCTGVLAATGLNQNGYKASYANMISDGVAVASGDVNGGNVITDVGILTTSNDGAKAVGGYNMVYLAGTSFAAPQAAGVAAMMLAVNPALTGQQLLEGIKASSRAFPSVGGLLACVPGQPQGNCNCSNDPAHLTCGSGILDADAAVLWAIGATPATLAAPVTSVNYFTPNRVSAARLSGGGGGGGGAADWPELLALAGLALLAVRTRHITARRP
ncbi:MAG: S8 family serine peptidase [Burkholderiales bacterium]|nr:S8 family serine peptidase [Burkholderiales bacterium]